MRVLFFARLREQLGISVLDIPEWGGGSVASLRAQLVEQGGQAWAEALEHDNIIIAVNQDVANADTQVSSSDEVAFFPPVTGG